MSEKVKNLKKKILLVYPKMPSTYWGFQYSVKFIGKKTTYPPLGLMTVAALIPPEYDLKLVNLNSESLKESDIAGADFVFISAMIVQKESFEEVVKLSRKHNKTVVAGGPYPTVLHADIEGVDHFVLDEAEMTLPDFFRDLKAGNPAKIYRSKERPAIALAPIPRFDLIKINDYVSMALQFSRGCPFNCEFCDIIELFGRVPRTKSPEQFIKELETVYETGYRGSVFIVDDNFIGNKFAVKQLLRPLGIWQKEKEYPFTFMTEASVNLAEDEELMDLMAEALFEGVFLGIETPSEESLLLANKTQNTKIKLLDSIHKIQRKGLEVSAGFILGFDSDKDDIFDRQINFINDAAIPMAMVGLLAALGQTQLYTRLLKENRILNETSGNHTHALELNFIPKMAADKLIEGYKKVISTVYDPPVYFERCYDLINILPNNYISAKRVTLSNILTYGYAFIRSLILQGFGSYGFTYFKFLARVLIKKPGRFAQAVKFAIFGYHFIKITEKQINKKMVLLDNFKAYINKLMLKFQKRIEFVHNLHWEKAVRELFVLRKKTLPAVTRKYATASKLSNQYTDSALSRLEESIFEYIARIRDYLMKAINNTDINTDNFINEFNKYVTRLLNSIDKNKTVSHRFGKLTEVIDKVFLELRMINSKAAGSAGVLH